MKVSKNKIELSDGSFVYYLGVLNFEDEQQWKKVSEEIDKVVSKYQEKIKVF